MFVNWKIFSFFVALFTYGQCQQRINVTVFYETLCPASVRLIQRQLYPTWFELEDYLNVTFIPYGKAVQNKDENGKWVFDCQNGPAECYGNKIQSCALYEFKGDLNLSMEYVRCFMANNNFYPYNTSTCFGDLTNDTAAKSRYDTCIRTEAGDELLALNGNVTSTYPPFSYIPAMSFNEVYDYDFDSKARTNFKGAVCQLIQNEKPSACSKMEPVA